MAMHSRRFAGGLAAIAAAAVIAVFAGIPAFRVLAFAQGGQGQTPKEPTFACSIKVPSGTRDADVQKLAKISEPQARDAAQKAVAGTVVRSEIENENGCAVYGPGEGSTFVFTFPAGPSVTPRTAAHEEA
jgi:hypothetical protein